MKQRMTRGQKIFLYMTLAFPAMLLFALFVIAPLVYGITLTFTDWNGISSTVGWAGWRNYAYVLHDSVFWQSIVMTIVYSSISVLSINVVAFCLAYILTSGVKWQNFLRAGFFTPNLIGGLILGYIWQFVFSRVMVNLHDFLPLTLFQKSWLSSPGTAAAALVIVTVWQYSGYMLLIYISGFVSVPSELIEAARIDGATEKQVTRRVRFPLMIPSVVVCLFLSITRTFKVYDLNLSLTAGGPYNTTRLAAMHIYSKAFEEQRYGEGQAEALVLFLIMALIALTQTYLGKKREVEL
jgi:raffinose/stachyose/melibiose transport system permease protein